MRIIAVCALGVAGYLAWSTLVVGNVAGCGGGAVMDCNHVLQSKYSSVLGIPVSIPAAALYIVLIAGLFGANSKRPLDGVWKFNSLCILAAAFAALWFIGVQVFVLKKLCWYCLVVHSCGLLLASMLLWLRPVHWRQLGKLAIPGVVSVLALAVVQHVSPEPKSFELTTDFAAIDASSSSMTFDMSGYHGQMTDASETFTASESSYANEPASAPSPFAGSPTMEAPSPSLSPVPDDVEPALGKPQKRYVDFRFAKVKLNTYDWPIIGSPDAQHVLLELFDYTCPHCQEMNLHLKAAQDRYGEQMAILVLPVPLNKDCNPYSTNEDPRHADACELARLSLSIWRLAPERFAEFHQYLFTTQPRPNAVDARQHAETIVDPEKLKTYLAGASVSRYIAAHANILKEAGGAPLPRVESEAFSLKGKTNQASDLFQTLESRLGMKRP